MCRQEPLAAVDRASRLFTRSQRLALCQLRRDLHQRPELSFKEVQTSERLLVALRDLGIETVQRVTETGLVARIPGTDGTAPPVAVRGDIDALPIEEETGLDYSSVHPGVMHACGHDVHATWTVGAACLLLAEPASGDVVLVLQPAEEIGQGAKAILETGALDAVAAIFAAHVDRTFEVGEVVVQAGPMAAAADTFKIELVGKGAHGARPHLSQDPVVAAAQLIMQLQTIVSRRLDPGEPAVVTVGTVTAGSAHNVIPERAVLSGTLRSLRPEIRAFLIEELRHLVGAVSDAHRVRAEIDVRAGVPPLLNSERESLWATRGVVECLGEECLRPMASLNMGGEDFAYYLERVPGSFLRVGAREPGGAVIGAHTPQFWAADDAIFVGAAALAAAARLASEELTRAG